MTVYTPYIIRKNKPKARTTLSPIRESVVRAFGCRVGLIYFMR